MRSVELSPNSWIERTASIVPTCIIEPVIQRKRFNEVNQVMCTAKQLCYSSQQNRMESQSLKEVKKRGDGR